MGWGVAQDQDFTHRLQQDIDSLHLKAGISRIEVLNFGVNGYSPLCHVVDLERRVLAFQPDVVIFMAHGSDPFWTKNRLARAMRDGEEVPAPARQIAERAGVKRKTSQPVGERRLDRHAIDLVDWAYQSIVRQCEERGTRAVWVYLPKPGTTNDEKAFSNLRRLAAKAGFATIDLRSAYGSTPMEELIVARWDLHPNARGHAMIAQALRDALVTNPGLLPIEESSASRPGS
jgi:hypothetical protein